MKLSISNIAWAAENDAAVYELMKTYGFSGLEIAPTRIFPDNPYDRLGDAAEWARKLQAEYGFEIPSMQSIWFGREEKLFGTERERETLLEYTKKAVNFAKAVGCKNLVFGCPRNRAVPDGIDQDSALSFFREIGDYAAAHGTVIGMEANPPVYNTNYINDTEAALDLIQSVGSEGFLLNLDLGTMIYNAEDMEKLRGKVGQINHVHISEPGLKSIEHRALHKQLRDVLENEKYGGYVSIEMGRTDNLADLENAMKYAAEIMG